jgi:hypothetical protein
MMMADDNAIDIIDRLPPIEVRKPWREKLPDYYIRHIDELVALHKNVVAICSRLRHPHLEQLSEVIENNGADDAHMRSVVSELEAAVVLLKCAEERLWHAIPFEEFLSRAPARSPARIEARRVTGHLANILCHQNAVGTRPTDETDAP